MRKRSTARSTRGWKSRPQWPQSGITTTRPRGPHAEDGGGHQGIVGAEDRELAVRQSSREGWRPESDQSANAAAVAYLEEVAGEDPSQAVPDYVELVRTRRQADGLDRVAELQRQALVVERGPVRETGQVPDAPDREHATQAEKVRRAAEQTVHEQDWCGVGRCRSEVIARQDWVQGRRGCEQTECGELRADSPEAHHGFQCPKFAATMSRRDGNTRNVRSVLRHPTLAATCSNLASAAATSAAEASPSW